MQLADRRRRLHAGRGRPAAPRHGRVAPLGPHREAPRAPDRAHAGTRASRREFAERVFEQIRGFGEYGFPESHAASFALIAYATVVAALPLPGGVHLRAAQRAADGLLLAGDDRRRRQAPRRRDPADRRHAQRLGLHARDPTDDGFAYAVRMGLRWVKGLALADGERDRRARAASRPFASHRGLRAPHARARRAARRARRGRRARRARRSLEPPRRAVAGRRLGRARRPTRSPLGGDTTTPSRFAPLSQLDEICWDYARSDHSTRGHPLAPLRGELARAAAGPTRAPSRSGRDGQRIDYVGIVICRQQPGTAAGVVFMTLEDETGFVNLVVWQQVFAQYALVLKTTVAARRHRPAAGRRRASST